jgi:hypothetical protein
MPQVLEHQESTRLQYGYPEVSALLDRIPELRSSRIRLALDVLEVGRESVQVQVTSPLAMTYEGDWDDLGLCVAEIIEMAEARRELLLWMMRRGEVSLAEAAAHTGAAERAVGAVLDTFAEQGFVRKMEQEDGARYRAQHAVRRNHRAGPFGRAGPGLPRWPRRFC